MSDETILLAPAAPEPSQVHPGDIAQVIDQAHPAFPAILLVWEVRGAHVEARIQGSRTEDTPPVRMKPGQFAVVGAAALLPPDLLKDRQASIATAELVARERG
jgi:hypothetical protein